MRQVELRSGESLVIREAEESDAAAIIAFIKAVGDETDYLTFSGDQFNLTIAEECEIIKTHRQASNRIFVIGLLDDLIVGQLNVVASPKPRLQHIGEFGISTRKTHWGKGVATAILQYMLDWAHTNPVIRKINLKANANNTKAIALYQRMGFALEGRHPRDFFIHGAFQDSISMGMLID